MHSAGPSRGQPPAVCSVCLPRLRGPEITGPLRCGGRRGTTPGHPAQGSRPRPLPGPGRCAPLRRLSRCGYFCSAPTHCPAQRGARRHSAAALRAARHRWAGANCRMTGLRQFAPAWFGVPATIRGHGRPHPLRGFGHLTGRALFGAASIGRPRKAGLAGAAGRALRCPATGPSCHPGRSVAQRGDRRQRQDECFAPLTPVPPMCWVQTTGRRAPVPNARPLQFWR